MKKLLPCIFLSLWMAQASCHKKPNTPIEHVVVIFQENRTFDHYFGTYPHAKNKKGKRQFKARAGTPAVNGLSLALKKLNTNQAKPFRFSPKDANTCDPNHGYTALQQNCDKGLLDQFVQINVGECPSMPSFVMGYFDGNTVTALWNYAQYFAMSDNFHTTVLSQSSIGAINLISGQTHGANPSSIPNKVVDGTLISDTDPAFDMCSHPPTVEMTGLNIGNLLNKKGVTWGWFEGGFADCSSTHEGPNGPVTDYSPHHAPFQYYQSTSNPNHLPPTSIEMIGYTDQANHNYDLSYFFEAIAAGNLPAVSFLKAAEYQDGHPGNSTPLLEQKFLVSTINQLQRLPQWESMAIIICYDDSGGWYDHEMPPFINQSQIPNDALVAPGNAGSVPPLGGYEGRPAYGFRVPFIVISPWAKENYVDHSLLDQTSILRFIEDNWDLGQIGDYSFDAYAGKLGHLFDFKKFNNRKLFLNKKYGTIKSIKTS